jgi:hypothetical protein
MLKVVVPPDELLDVLLPDELLLLEVLLAPDELLDVLLAPEELELVLELLAPDELLDELELLELVELDVLLPDELLGVVDEEELSLPPQPTTIKPAQTANAMLRVDATLRLNG